jgi:hypothetical protein
LSWFRQVSVSKICFSSNKTREDFAMSLQCCEFDCEEETTIVYHQWRDVTNFPSCLVWISLRE